MEKSVERVLPNAVSILKMSPFCCHDKNWLLCAEVFSMNYFVESNIAETKFDLLDATLANCILKYRKILKELYIWPP